MFELQKKRVSCFFISLLVFVSLLISSQVSAAPASDASKATLKRLEQSTWIQDGKSTAPRVIYMFTDLNCPYCAVLWRDLRPWVNSGKVQVRHILLGVVKPTSLGKAVGLLSQKNPSQALLQHEKASIDFRAKNPGKRLPESLGIQAPARFSSDALIKLQQNAQLANDMQVTGTPALFWLDDDGDISVLKGVPQGSLSSIFGKP